MHHHRARSGHPQPLLTPSSPPPRGRAPPATLLQDPKKFRIILLLSCFAGLRTESAAHNAAFVPSPNWGLVRFSQLSEYAPLKYITSREGKSAHQIWQLRRLTRAFLSLLGSRVHCEAGKGRHCGI